MVLSCGRWWRGRLFYGVPDWIGCHVGAFASFGGAARQIVCDNLKADVTTASRYEPGISRSYQDMATHDGTVILPAKELSLVTRPRSRSLSRLSSAGSWPGCGTSGSSP